MGTHLWSTGLWLVLLAAVATHGAAGSETCPQDCPKSSSVFHYQDGKKYSYSLEGTTITTLPGTQGDVSKLHLKATVEVGVKSACSHIVRLKGLQITGPDEKKYSLKELEGSPVIANFQGGPINSQICTAEGDSQASLNIKRAVLSLLQSSASSGSGSSTSIREVDVFGICPTDITYTRSGDTTTIKKSRNLNLCAHRENLKQDFLSTPFVGNAELQSVPLLESTLNVEQNIKKGILVSAVSEESYLYRPFAKQNAGARTTVETRLTLTGEKAQAPAAPESITVPRSIIFEITHDSTQKSNKQAIIAALQAAKDSMPDAVGPDSARKFQTLVGVLRQSSKDDILSVYREVKAGAGFSNKQDVRKVLLDALFRTGTGDSVGVAVELIRSKEISGEYSKLWYSGFAFVRHATSSSVTAVSSLLDEPNLPREAILGIGSLVGRYCRDHSCENSPEVDELINKLSTLLTTSISSREEENKVIGALKALHNIHHLNNAVADILHKLASDKNIPARVRVAALETYQSDACRSILKKSAWEILNNKEEDSEIRIKAYLVLVECPCGTVANNLKELLENEPTNQVGSYIVSHLRNLRASANPAKADAKHHLGLLRSRKHYPEDIRKYSNNYELSYILDALNIGTTVESNVIFSQSSYVPRSISLNLTTDLFGHSYNILEIGTRAENADRILESYLGPKGYLNTHNVGDIIQNAKEALARYGEKIRERLQKIIRHKRSINQADLERIRNEVIQSLPPSPGNELIVDLSVKLFGAELAWLSNDYNTHDLSPDGIVNKLFGCFDDAIEKAKNFDHHLKQHWTFLDSELTYPTGTGLPLRLIASGSTAVHLKLAGQIDIPALINDPKNALLKLEIVPSASVEVTGELLVNAQVVEAGLKVAFTLHTATGADVGVKILEGSGVDITFGLPLKKQDIFTLKSEVLKTVHESGHTEVDTPLVFTSSNKEYKGCFDQLKELTGLVVCGEVSLPSLSSGSAFYPLNGQSLVSLNLEASDVSSYHLRGYLNNKDPKHQSLEVLIETPGTKTQRKLALLVEGNTEPNKEIKISLTSPWKTIGIQGILVDSSTEQSITAKLLNDDIEYSVKAGVKVSGDPSHQTYTPLLEYKHPDQKSGAKRGKSSQIYNVQGSVTVDRAGNSRKYTFNKVSLNTPQGRYEVDGTVSKDSNVFSTDIKVSWGDKNIIIRNKVQKISPTHYTLSFDVIPSKQKDLSIGLRWEYERSDDELRNEIEIIHGQDLRSDQSRITISQYLHYKIESSTSFDISTRNSLTYPILNINVKLEGGATPKNIDYNLLVNYDIYKVASELHAKTGVKKLGDYDIVFVAQILNNTLRLTSNRDIIADGQSKFVNVLELIPIARYEFDAVVTHQYERNNINQQIDAIFKIDGQPDEYKADIGFILNPQLLDTHTKILIGADKILDASVVVKRQSNEQSADLKAYAKNYIDASASYQLNESGGKGALRIDIPKIQRKILGNAVLTIAASVYTGDVDLQWNADIDPKQKLSIHTTNDIKTDSIESKNVITILDYKTVLNLKGALTGKLTDGHLIANGDITLPSGRHISLKVDRNLQIRAVSEGQIEIVLIDTVTNGGQSRKLILEGGATNVDPKQLSFEGNGKLEYKTLEGKDIRVIVKAVNSPQGEQRKLEGEIHIDGSLVPKSLQAQFNSDVSKSVVTYKANGRVGSDIKGSISGTVKTGLGGQSPREIDNTIEVFLPSENIQQVKLSNSLSLLIQREGPNEIKTHNVLSWNADKTLKVDGQFNSHHSQGSAKIVVTLPQEQPRGIALTWSRPEGSENEIKRAGSAVVHWDGDKEAKFAGEVTIHTGNERAAAYKLSAVTPHEKLKNLDLTLTSKITESNLEANGILNLNDKKITLDGKIGRHGVIPFIDISIVHESGTTKLYLNPEKLTEEQIKFQFISQHPILGISIDTDVDIHLDIETPKLRITLDAPKLNMDKWLIEAGQRSVKGAKKIVFSVKSHDNTIVSGSTTLRQKVDGNTVTYDGSGTIEIGDQGSQRFSYKLERVHLTQDANKESGIEYKLNVDAGQKTLRSSVKSTNHELGTTNKYCVKGTCSIIDVNCKLTTGGLNELTHEAVLNIDLKNLDVPVAVSVREHTVREGFTFDHELDIQLQYGGHRTAYNSRALINENSAVVNITLPQRVLSLEINTNLKLEGSLGEQDVSLQLWWDRVNKPSLRTVASASLKQKHDKNGLQLSSRARFNNPSLERELGITGYLLIGGPNKLFDSSLDIDIFKKANQKIVITAEVVKQNINEGYNVSSNFELKSKGQNIEIVITEYAAASLSHISYSVLGHYRAGKQATKEIALSLDVTKEKFNALIKLPNINILEIDGTASAGNNLPIDGNAEISVIGLTPLVIQTSIQKRGLIAITSTIYRKGTPNRKLILSGGIENGAYLRAEVIKQSERQSLAHIVISGKEEDFLKTDFSYSTENIENFIAAVRQELEEIIQKGKEVIINYVNQVKEELIQLLEILKKSQPNVPRLFEVAQQQIKAIRIEIENDEVLKEISQHIKDTTGNLLKIIEDALKAIGNTINSLLQVLVQFQNAVIESIKKASPAISKLWSSLVNATVSLIETFLQEVSVILSHLGKLLKTYEPEIKRLISSINELIHDATKVISSSLHRICNEIVDFSKIFIDEIKQFPVYTAFKEKYQEAVEFIKSVELPTNIWNLIEELIDLIKGAVPNEELRDLITTIEEYVEKHVKKEAVDDQAELQKIYQKLVHAIKSIVLAIQKELTVDDSGAGLVGYKSPISLATLVQLPRLLIVRLSPLAYLASDDLPRLVDLYYTYKPTLNPLDWIPPFKTIGVIIGQNNFLTFDKRHYTFKGSCSYILAEDYLDGNFSLVVTMEEGKLKSIIISDKSDTVELHADKSLKVNGAASEYPVQQGDINVWRRYYSVHIKSKAGVYVHCHNSFDLCAFHVSGFYHGRVRGLLGTIDNEHYDDLQLPNGNVAPLPDEFANAWKIDSQCANVAVPTAPADVPAKECAEVLSGQTSLRPCYAFINPTIIREACNEAVALSEDKIQTACDFAEAYIEGCRHKNVPVSLPTICRKQSTAQCEVIGGEKISAGETVTIKTPQKSADVVIIVEQVLDNAEIFKDFITPLVSTLTNDLKKKGITDVKYALIGYGAPGQKWPSHITNNGELGFGKDNIKFIEREPLADVTLNTQTFLQWIKLKYETGMQRVRQIEAFAEGIQYPFRAGAAKAIIGVISTPCAQSGVLSPIRIALAKKTYPILGLNLHVIAPIEDIHLADKEQPKVNTIVGFDNDAVYTLDRKKPDGDSALRSSLEFTSNVCADITQAAQGVIYSKNNFVRAKASERKQYTNVVANRIASSLTGSELTEQCLCLLHDGVHPETLCRVTARREKEQTGKKGVKG